VKLAVTVLGLVVVAMGRICSAEITNAQTKTVSATNAMKAPRVECGVLTGRDGAAFGPGVTCQANFEPFGFYGFGGQSWVNNHQAGGGIIANFSDRSLGFGIDARIFHLSRFVFGIFGQAAYYGSRVHATYFDLDNKVSITYGASDRDPLITVGPEIRFAIVKGVSGIIRPGKDFGNNFAATTAGGFSINGGVLVSAHRIGTSIIQLKKIF